MTSLHKSINWKIYWKLNKIPVWILVVIVMLLIFLCSIGLSMLPIEPPDKSLEKQSPLYFDIIMACVFAPIVETLAFQFIPLEVCQYVFREKFKKRFYGLSIILSALIFGCVHCYNWTYMLYAFVTGLFLATVYIIKRQNGMKSAILTLWIIHCAWNVIYELLILFNL